MRRARAKHSNALAYWARGSGPFVHCNGEHKHMPIYVGTAYSKGRIRPRMLGQTGGHATRFDALDEAFTRWPTAARVSTGYGYNGGFDIRSTTRDEWIESIAART